MDVATDTPIGTPTKCGCAGGIVVSCGTASAPRNRPSPTLRRRYQIVPPPECPMCAEEALNNQYRAAKCAALNEALTEGSVVNDHSSDVKVVNSGRERRSYAAMLRGALGRWSGKRRRPTKNREAAMPNHYSQVPNSCTNNNCESPDRCKLNMSDESRTLALPVRINGEGCTGNETAPSLDPNPEREGRVAKGSERNAGNKSSTAVNHTLENVRPSGSPCNKDVTKTDGQTCQKLPSLPYREERSKAKSSETGAVDNTKRRRGKRKYFSSPIHRKEPNRDSTGDVQSTYVSFQDDLAQDVQLNVQRSPAMTKSTSRKTSWSRRAAQRKRSDSDASPAEVSPTTLSDDVFTDSPNNSSPTARGGFPTPDVRNGVKSEPDMEDDALIERLFHKVNAAFGAPGSRRSNSESVRQMHAARSRHHTYNYDEKSNWNRPDARPTPVKYNMAPGKKESHHEPIDAIMASANLHASLDNAMCMLSESTKLLSPLDQSGLLLPDYAARHGSVSGGNAFLASHQPFRPRTYSTCSRLETIAEENDRTEDSTPDLDRKNTEDVTSCAFSDASEYEKALLQQVPRSDRDSVFSALTKTSYESDYASASLQRRHAEAMYGASQASMDEYDQKTRLLLRSCPNSTIRRQSTSTISVRGVPRSHESPPSEVLGQVFGPTTEDKCAACEWARRSQFHFQTVQVIPTSAWPRIVNSSHQCKDGSHFHPWGVCAHRHDPPVLCHSHYLQYYQYLQRHPKPVRHHRQPLRSASSQGDSLIDYDINEVISSLDELVTSNPSSAHSSTTNIFRSHYQHAMAAGHHMGQGDHKVQLEERYSAHYLDVRHYNKTQTHKKSDTDVSVNSDSAFSTNGSLTPSTRDGVNTDRDSIDSMTDAHHADQDMLDGRKTKKLGGQASLEGPDQTEGVHNLPPPARTFISKPGFEHSWVPSRGQRTQSYEDAKPQKTMLSANDCPDKRYSVVSSVGSSSPLISDHLCDSAVHLQDNCSSHSTQLSSDSFYSTGTSHGDKDTCLLDRALSLHSISRSSSEASLNSEGTLCLSDYAMSQQNIALSCAHSFPQINDICSPVHTSKSEGFSKQPPTDTLQTNRLAQWIEQAGAGEAVLETFIDEDSHFPTIDTGTIKPNRKRQDPLMEVKGFFDTLASSSGSSDSNTLGSGSSGSTYATSSLRSYMSNSRFNTFDSSSCVSTDDTGETVIDQHTLRQNGRLHDIDEMPVSGVRVRRKRSGNDDKKRYRASAFHYENLDMPQFDCDGVDDESIQHPGVETYDADTFEVAVSSDVTKNTRIRVSRVRSSSLSCITTSVTRVACVVRQCKSLSDIQETECNVSTLFQKIEIARSNTVIPGKGEEGSPAIIEQNWSPKSSAMLQTKVDSMIQNCNDFDNIIASLRESLRHHTTSEDSLDQKLLELGEILKQKDEVINQLHSMLLMSYAYSRHPSKYSANATI